MLEFITGIIAGCFSGIGMGGGTILILILSVFMGIDQHIAQATNLIFFIPTAIIIILISIKKKIINLNNGIPLALFGMIGSFIGAKVAINMNVIILKKAFGFFLFFITLIEINSILKMYKRDKNIDNKNRK